MKLVQWVALVLGVVPQVLASKKSDNVQLSVVELDKTAGKNNETISYNQAYIYLSKKFGTDDNVSIGSGGDDIKDTIDMINQHFSIEETSSLPKLIITIDGSIDEDKDQESHQNIESLSFGKPTFSINSGKSHKLLKKIGKNLQKNQKYTKIQLSNELTLLSKDKLLSRFIEGDFFELSSNNQWTYNQDKLEALHSDEDDYSENTKNQLKLINDPMFKHEIIQLMKLNQVQFNPSDHLLMNLNGLLSIGKKIDFNSHSYQVAKQTLINVISKLQSDFDITLLITNNKQENSKYSCHLNKRNGQLNNLFKKSVGSICFISEEACNKDTNDCSNHGKCVKSAISDCWSCKCSPTIDKSTNSKTYWAGSTCSKRDVSSQANLLLWTGLGLFLLIVGGIQFLYSVGNENLPGILDAATNPKKN